MVIVTDIVIFTIIVYTKASLLTLVKHFVKLRSLLSSCVVLKSMYFGIMLVNFLSLNKPTRLH